MAIGFIVQQPSEEKPKKTIFDLKLESYEASSKIKILKELRSVTNLDPKAVKELVENMPAVFKEGMYKILVLLRERMKGSNPLIILGMDVGYNRMGLAVSNDMTSGFDHVGVLDTHRFRKVLKFIELASDVRTSLNLVVMTKRAAIKSFKLAKQLDDYSGEEKPKKTIFDLKLESYEASSNIKILKELRSITNLDPKAAKELVENMPAVFKEGMERMKGSNPLIILGMDVGYNRMGLAVSNDMTSGFDHVGVLDTHRFRKVLKFIELASDVRTSLDLVVTTKRAAIESFKLAKQLNDYLGEEKPKKTIFDLKLESYEASSKIKILKELRSVTNLDPKAAKELVMKEPGDAGLAGATKEEKEEEGVEIDLKRLSTDCIFRLTDKINGLTLAEVARIGYIIMEKWEMNEPSTIRVMMHMLGMAWISR
ncbi:hypothetical protein EZV62_011999 [Acer yangbiense]|uniref:Large ribosomal subunit protein bL12 C-terminal domain-containing protein n=1 Tax=Acer yangbiense TaxID=1000413 RepID=A0A5C7I777_9ROSI|nr:hypothetical protein EZV62_011999 [Acer yangbiense]